ncbi:hypothetical protein GCM10027047_14980 [Rhodococcus aerolatus]
MDEQRFWDLIDSSRAEAGGRLEEQAEALHTALSGLDPDDVARFDALLTEANHALYTWAHWGAADLVLGEVRDDTFTDVRSWVVAQGSEVFHAVVEDPDALADTDDDLTEDGALLAREWADTADAVHTGLTGHPLDAAAADRVLRHEPDDQPLGTQLSDEPEDLAVHFPRLAQRYR